MVTFGLIHGSWHGAWSWGPLVAELAEQGYAAVAMDLPTEDCDAGAREYAQAVVDALSDVQDEVVLVGHSVGGLTVPLVATMRPVQTMVFVAAGVPSPGRSHWDQSQDGRLRVGGVYERAVVDDQGRNLLPPDVAADVLYHECPPDVAQWAASQLRWQAQKIVREPTPLDEWPNVPSRYVVCRRDRIVRTEWQLAEASVRVGDRSPVELDSDHSPMLSRPRELAAVLADIARDLEVVSASA